MMKRTHWIAPLLALALLPAQERPGQAAAGGDFRARVDRAVDRGATWLLKRQTKDGSWGTHGYWAGKYELGPTALALLTLIHCGKNAHSKPLERGFQFLFRGVPKLTYEVGLVLMALEARATPSDEWEALRKYHAGRTADLSLRPKRFLTPREKTFASLFTSWLVKNRSRGRWHYKEYPTGGDLSNTQYALLGLRAAARLGVVIPPRLWYDSLQHFLRTQAQRGPPVRLVLDDLVTAKGYNLRRRYRCEARGWGYPGNGPPAKATGSMTTVGVASLVICRDELNQGSAFRKAEKNLTKRQKLNKKAEQAILDGLAWLQECFQVHQNPVLPGAWRRPRKKQEPVGPEGHHGGAADYYYLYGLERAGVLAAVRKLGSHDWYREGAEFLLGKQRAEGRWHNEIGWRSHLTATCFALLFLKRSTYPPVLTVSRRK